MGIQIAGPAPSDEEAAAVVAAIERFVADTAPAAPAPTRSHDAWFMAGLLQATGNDAENPFHSGAGL